MEISSSAVGVMRVGIQIVSSHRNPLLEIFHQVHNRIGPETEFTTMNGIDNSTHTFKNRDQDVFIQFTMVNIGGERAENIKLTISGDLKRAPPLEDYGSIFKNIYPQIASGQVHYLFRFRTYDLLEYAYKDNVGIPQGLKKSSFTIIAEYDSPSGIMNWLLSIPSRIMKKRRFKSEYTFHPYMVDGELPPAEYA